MPARGAGGSKLANVLRHPEDDRSLIRGVMDRLDAIQANQV